MNWVWILVVHGELFIGGVMGWSGEMKMVGRWLGRGGR